MEITSEAKKRLAALIEELGVPLAPLAVKVGVSQSTLWNFIYGDTRNFSKIHRLATELKISLDWILNGDAPAHGNDRQTPTVFRAAEPQAWDGPDNAPVPVVGRPGGAGDALQIDWQRKNADTGRHPGQKGVKDAFAIYVAGEKMSPRYKSGEIAYAVFGKAPAKGQDCLVELVSGESYLREFVSSKNGTLLCRQFNPAKECKWPVEDVKALHAIIGRG